MSLGAPFVLVIDLGTTSLRCSVVDATGSVRAWRQSTVPETRDGDGLSWDGGALAAHVLADVRALAEQWSLAGIAIANQRTTALIWDAASGSPLGPVLSWSDSRTRDLDRALRARGVEMVPGLSVSKWRWLLDRADADGARARAGELRVGTLESWLVWVLSDGAAHISDHVNASHSGLLDLATLDWNRDLMRDLNLDPSLLPRLVSCLPEGLRADAIIGTPPILAVIGDQQASLYGQGCVAPGTAKITFGTSGVLDMVLGDVPFATPSRAAFGNIALSTPEGVSFGTEASVMSVGSAVEWLIRLGVLTEAGDIDRIVDPTVRGDALFVAALDGLGVPHWQPRARASFFGLSGATGPGEMVRAVLEGIVAGTADIIAQMEQATGQRLERISIDGGLTRSDAFCAILAATIDRPLYRAPSVEATTRGAAMLAHRGLGLPTPMAGESEQLLASNGAVAADLEGWRDATALTLAHTKNRKKPV
ncbi:FGGY-family carbohydrate kinase [Oceanibium sediminis]|uniref:FGGY-family carbohydrate kinase n=1 Tax=Oceanibium sediminis TaxID=2026339 RepID=UPI000DD4E62A|nr:FGGY-family carbohydrate kinase [Oceanibium sediminis]